MLRRSALLAANITKQLATTAETALLSSPTAPPPRFSASQPQQPLSSSFRGISWSAFSPSKDKDKDKKELPLDNGDSPPMDTVPPDAITAELPSPDLLVDTASLAETAARQFAAEDAWFGSKGLQYLLHSVHDNTSLDWWAAIAVSTGILRLISFPVNVMQIKNTYNLSKARPEVEQLVENLKARQAAGDAQAVGEYQAKVSAVWKKHNCNPFKSLATVFVQAPIFIAMFTALRALATAKVPSMAEGGILWFSDLTSPDPYYALPVIASASFLLLVELGAADGMEGQPQNMQKKMKLFMRILGVGIVPFTLNMPAGVFMYWTTSNLFSLAQTSTLKISPIRKMLGLPPRSAMAALGNKDTSNNNKGAAVVPSPGQPVKVFTANPVQQQQKSSTRTSTTNSGKKSGKNKKRK
jgi:YidC/Oxa1 family membrane protein insertase